MLNVPNMLFLPRGGMPGRGYIKTTLTRDLVKRGYTRNEIAEYLGIYYTTVSNAVSIVEK